MPLGLGAMIGTGAKALLGKGGLSAFAGSMVKGGIGSLLGSAINRHSDREGMRDRWSYMESKGLTPQEIAGSGAAGGGASSAGNTLGNQAAQQDAIAAQQAYDEEQRALDRAVQVRAQDVSARNTETAANASITSSSLSAGASRNAAATSERIAQMRNALDRGIYENVTLPDALRRSVTESPGWKRAQIMAGMGVDNMVGTAIGNKYGLNPMDPAALDNMSDDQFMRMVTEIYGLQSNIFSEGSGAQVLGGAVRSNFSPPAGAPALGSGATRDQGR